MKTVAKYFIFAFCISFLFGVWQGCQERRATTDEELQAQTAILNWKPASNDKRPTMNYVCGSIQIFTYDLQTDEQREYQHPVVEASVFSSEGAERVFEAATGLKLLEMLRIDGKAESASELLTGKRVALIAGSLSGYFAGRAVAARTRPDCSSSILLAKLRDKNSPLSARVRREYFRQYISFLCVNVDGNRQRIIDSASSIRIMLDKESAQVFKLPQTKEEVRRSIPVIELWDLEKRWDRFSDTSFNPSGKDCLEVVRAVVSLKDILEFEPDVLKEAYPNAKNISVEYSLPTATLDNGPFLSSRLMVLTVGGCFVVLAILGVVMLVGHFRDKRKTAGRAVGFAPATNHRAK